MLDRATRLVLVLIVGAGVLAVAVVLGGTAGYAADAQEPTFLAADSIEAVVANIRVWLLSVLAAWATLCLTVAFFRYTSGDPEEIAKAKVAARAAAVGYAGALLAPLIVTIVAQWVA